LVVVVLLQLNPTQLLELWLLCKLNHGGGGVSDGQF
jgi:hypothetical protein